MGTRIRKALVGSLAIALLAPLGLPLGMAWRLTDDPVKHLTESVCAMSEGMACPPGLVLDGGGGSGDVLAGIVDFVMFIIRSWAAAPPQPFVQPGAPVAMEAN